MRGMAIEFGLDTFGDVTNTPDGRTLSHPEVLQNVVAEAVLADELGIDFFGVGEHHRRDFAVSAPEVVLAAIAASTQRIKLGSAVTVLSSDDPVRVFERFATVDGLSGGRAEVIMGRGSFTESFPLFGYNLEEYHELFEEKLDLFAALLHETPVTWEGRLRPSLHNADVFPKTTAGHIRTWVGVGGSPESVIRTARYGFPLLLAIIGGSWTAFEQYAELYRRALAEFTQEPQPIGVHSPGYIAETDEQALREFWPYHAKQHAKFARERGWGPTSEAQYRRGASPTGALFIGSPETVAQKLALMIKQLGLQRFHLKYSIEGLPHEQSLRTIELYGTKVIPRVRELLAQ